MEFEQRSPWANGVFKGRSGMVETSLKQLEYFQKHNTSDKPKELAWEIKFMRWVHSGGETRCAEYFDKRYSDENIPKDRRTIAKNMGYLERE